MKIRYLLNDKLRIKVTDKCNMHCSFCHFEGAKGANDLAVNDETIQTLKSLRQKFSAVHITGGEPFLYPDLFALIDVLERLEYKISITTNGYFQLSQTSEIADRLNSINFSLHSFNDAYLCTTVNNVKEYKSRVTNNILSLKDKVDVRINTVATSNPNQHIEDIVKFCFENKITINILQELNHNILSIYKEKLRENGFTQTEKVYMYPGSNVRHVFQDSRNNKVVFKEIELFTPDFLCKDCRFIDECNEGFSFIRLENNPLKIRMCLNQKSISYNEFMCSYYNQICKLLEAPYESELRKERPI